MNKNNFELLQNSFFSKMTCCFVQRFAKKQKLIINFHFICSMYTYYINSTSSTTLLNICVRVSCHLSSIQCNRACFKDRRLSYLYVVVGLFTLCVAHIGCVHVKKPVEITRLFDPVIFFHMDAPYIATLEFRGGTNYLEFDVLI